MFLGAKIVQGERKAKHKAKFLFIVLLFRAELLT